MSKLLRGRRGANSGVDERNWSGRNGSVLDTFQWQANEDERKIKDVLPKFDENCLHRTNETYSVGPCVISCQMFVKSEFPLDSALVCNSD